MEREIPGWQLGKLAEELGGELDGPPEALIRRPVPLGSNDPEGITFAEAEKYYEAVRNSTVGAVLLPHGAPDLGRPAIRVASPRQAFGQILARAEQPLAHEPGIHPTAVVSPLACVDPSAVVGPYAVVADAEIGPGCVIHAHCFVGDRCVIGAGSILYPRVTLVMNVTLGRECIIHSGAVLGADGFGYAWDGSQHRKIPQVGGVRLGDRVEIGANTTIDRATCGETTLGDGVKVDNLVMIAHNCQIGPHCVFASQVGIAGSSTIGPGAVFGGQVAVSDHVQVAGGVQLAGRTGVMSSVDEPGAYFGIPATPIKLALRQVAVYQKLPELAKRVAALEAELDQIKKA